MSLKSIVHDSKYNINFKELQIKCITYTIETRLLYAHMSI